MNNITKAWFGLLASGNNGAPRRQQEPTISVIKADDIGYWSIGGGITDRPRIDRNTAPISSRDPEQLP